MIKEYNQNIKKCPNCSTHLTFDDDDVQEIERNDTFHGTYKERFIKCPKCKHYCSLY